MSNYDQLVEEHKKLMKEYDKLVDITLSYRGMLTCLSWWLTGDLPEANAQQMYEEICREFEVHPSQKALNWQVMK